MLSILSNHRNNLRPTKTSKTNINFKGKENLIKIFPSILAADAAYFGRDIRKVIKGGADGIHFDVMDANFVQNISFGIPVLASVKKITKKPFDVHLMMAEPEKFIDAFKKAGADFITFHYEAAKKDSGRIIRNIKSLGLNAGIAINPKTEAEEIFKFLPDVDQALVMTVEPGFGAQGFIHECLKKIQKIKEQAGNKLIIQVDGGINNETGKLCREVGANSLVSGSYIYKNTTPAGIKAAIDSLRG